MAQMDKAVEAAMHRIFVDAINRVGMARFKSTSMFASNQRKVENKDAA